MSLMRFFRRAARTPTPPPTALPAAPARPSSPADALLESGQRALRSQESRSYARGQARADAQTLLSFGETGHARTLLTEALTEFPDNALRMELVRVLRLRGEHAPAIQLLRLLVLDPAHAAEADRALGELLEDQGDPGAARRHLERALAVDPANAVVRERVRRLRTRQEGERGLPAEHWDATGRLWAEAAAGPGFRVLTEVGRGGAATLFHAQEAGSGRDVALKVFHPRGDPAVRAERVRLEAMLATRATHPGVVPVLDAFPQRDLMVMPLYREGSLRTHLPRYQEDPVAALLLMVALLRTLAELHRRGVPHLDLKPSNILMAHGQPLLADFGAAAAVQLGQHAGTPPYLAPEVAMGATPDARSDLYAVGVLLVELLCGAAVPEARLLAPMPAGGALAEVAGRLLDKDPERRLTDTPVVLELMCGLSVAVSRAVSRRGAARPPG